MNSRRSCSGSGMRLVIFAASVTSGGALRWIRVGRRHSFALKGWLDAFLPTPMSADDFEEQRREQWPEQYKATLDEWASPVAGDCDLSARLRPMLRRTQLETRSLRQVYDANADGWDCSAFHAKCDTLGAALVYGRTRDGDEIGAYNPKGWASMGNARPSPAAFLYNLSPDVDGRPTKIRAESYMGCNSVSSDAPSRGIDFGVEAFCVPLRADEDRGSGSEKRAYSKLGVYFEGEGALWGPGKAKTTMLTELKVFAGVYAPGEEYPYSGAVMDMTSG